MRVSVCVGNYAKTPYCVPGIQVNVYCMEELCYCLKENAFLLDASLMSDNLARWVEEACGLKDLARELSALIHRKGSLSAFVSVIMGYVGLYPQAVVKEVERLLKQGAGLSRMERRKSQVDYLTGKKKYIDAVREYDALLAQWQEAERKGEPLPAPGCLSGIQHNKGVALTGLMRYEQAAESFLKAYQADGDPDCYRAYLAAKRMCLTEEAYIAFAAEQTSHYQQALELEKDMERLAKEWEKQPEYLLLYGRRERRNGLEAQEYDQEGERIIRSLKNDYRDSAGG